MVACPNMQTESELFRVMELVDNYTIEQDTLLLNTKTELLAKFIATKIKDK
jgi:heat shock protein HslJ